MVSLFPFVGISGANFDTQPWSIILLLFISFLIILGNFKKIDLDSLTLLIWSVGIICFAAIVTLFQETNGFVEFSPFTYVRNILSWLTIPLFIFVFSNTNKESIRNIFIFSIFIYFIVGAIQIFNNPNFLSFITPRDVNVLDGRGVPSLASEQFEFGRIALVQIIIAQILYLSKELKLFQRNLIFVVSFIELFIFSRAATAIGMLVGIVFIFYLLKSKSLSGIILRFAVSFTSILIFLVFLAEFFPQVRFGLIAEIILNNPSALSSYGGTIERIFNFPFSIYVGLIKYFPFGFGLGSEIILGQLYEFNLFLNIKRATASMANGGLVGSIYSTGILGLLWIAILIKNTFKYVLNQKTEEKKEWIIVFASILVITFFEGSLANPIVGLLFAIFLVYTKTTKV